MTKPIWKKVTEIEPGMYYFGGAENVPREVTYVDISFYQNIKIFSKPYWLARIGDIPQEPEMPLPELEVDTKVQVRDSVNHKWENKHFAEFRDGVCHTWRNGGTSWTTNVTISWSQWRLPEGPE